jgi:ferredoxin
METMFEEFKLGTARLVNRFVFPPIKLACGNPNGKVKREEELRALKAGLQALSTSLSFLERRIREMEHRPRPSISKAFVAPERCLGCGVCEVNCPAGQLLSRGPYGLMLSAVSAADVALRYVLSEQSPCVPNDLTVKERLEGPFEMPYLSIWA